MVQTFIRLPLALKSGPSTTVASNISRVISICAPVRSKILVPGDFALLSSALQISEGKRVLSRGARDQRAVLQQDGLRDPIFSRGYQKEQPMMPSPIRAAEAREGIGHVNLLGYRGLRPVLSSQTLSEKRFQSIVRKNNICSPMKRASMDPTLKTRIIATLKNEIPTLPRGLRTAAKYVVDHPSDFGIDTIRETARKSGISPYTLVRLAERLEFGGYDELREPFRQALVSSAVTVEKPAWIDRLREGGDLGRIQAEAALNEMSIVQRTLEGTGVEQMERVVSMLMAAPNVYLTAVRASYALAYYLHYVGRMALPSLQLIPRHMNSPIDELNHASPDDVMIAITFTPYSRDTIEACRFAKRKGMKLIMIADSEIVSPEFSADETLIVSVLSTYHFGCYAGAMALIETLIAQLVARGGEASRRRIASYEELRRDNQAYWVGPKKR